MTPDFELMSSPFWLSFHGGSRCISKASKLGGSGRPGFYRLVVARNPPKKQFRARV